MYKKTPKIAFLSPTKPHYKSIYHKTVATEIFFKTKSPVRIFCIKKKCAATNKAIIQEAHMFSKKNFKKTSSNNGIKSENDFFGTKMRSFSEVQS